MSSRADQIKLWDMIDLDDGYSHLRDASINKLCFFFKDSNDSLFSANTSSKLENLGPFSHKRWIDVREAHCVFQNKERGQAGGIHSDNTTEAL
jgi:hypothetical protein